jgi:hypothetical protein
MYLHIFVYWMRTEFNNGLEVEFTATIVRRALKMTGSPIRYPICPARVSNRWPMRPVFQPVTCRNFSACTAGMKIACGISFSSIWAAITDNGVRFAWLTFDEGYGRSVPFLRELDQMGQNYVAEIPQDTMVRTACPEVLYKARSQDRRPGRQKRYPRLKVKNNAPEEVRHILKHSPRLRHEDAGSRYKNLIIDK